MLAGLSQNLMLAGRSSESVAFAERAIETARAIGDPGIESRAMNVLGVDRATLGDIAGGIDLLRRCPGDRAAGRRPDGGAARVREPRQRARDGRLRRRGARGHPDRRGQRPPLQHGAELPDVPRGQRRGHARSSSVAIRRRPILLDRNASRVLPGVTTIHLNVTLAHLHLQTGDLAAARRDLDVARAEAVGLADAQFVIDIHAFGTEIEEWSDDPRTALAIAREGFDRLVDMDDAIILGQLAIPGVRAAADLAVRARAGRDDAAAQEAMAAARNVIDRYRAATDRLMERDDLARRRELGWRMALCEAELRAPAAWTTRRPGRPSVRRSPRVPRRSSRRTCCGGPPRLRRVRAAPPALAAATEPLREAHAIATRIGAGVLVGADRGPRTAAAGRSGTDPADVDPGDASEAE